MGRDPLPAGLKILKWILILGFAVSFALPFGDGVYGIYVFLFTPFEVVKTLKRDLLDAVSGETLFLFLFAADSKLGVQFNWETATTLVLGIVWVSNFTAFFLRRKRIIYFMLVAHVLFFGLLQLASDSRWWFPPSYVVWTLSVIGLHVLRLFSKPATPEAAEESKPQMLSHDGVDSKC